MTVHTVSHVKIRQFLAQCADACTNLSSRCNKVHLPRGVSTSRQFLERLAWLMSTFIVIQDLEDEDGTCWPVTLTMSSCGAAKRMFILEKIGNALHLVS